MPKKVQHLCPKGIQNLNKYTKNAVRHLIFSAMVTFKAGKVYFQKKTTTTHFCTPCYIFVKRIFAAVFCCVPNALFNPEFLLV